MFTKVTRAVTPQLNRQQLKSFERDLRERELRYYKFLDKNEAAKPKLKCDFPTGSFDNFPYIINPTKLAKEPYIKRYNVERFLLNKFS